MSGIHSLEAAAAGIGIGLALAGAPGPVQAVLLSEVTGRGRAAALRALAGVQATFAAMVLALALGVTVAAPEGVALRALRAAGGILLLWLAAEGARTEPDDGEDAARRTLPPAARGSLAILLNPGAWLFLAIVAAPLVGEAARADGRLAASAVALAMVAGAAIGDAGLVLLAAAGARRLHAVSVRRARLALAFVLAGLGVWLLVGAIVG